MSPCFGVVDAWLTFRFSRAVVAVVVLVLLVVVVVVPAVSFGWPKSFRARGHLLLPRLVLTLVATF